MQVLPSPQRRSDEPFAAILHDAASRRTQVSATVGTTADFQNNYDWDRFGRLTGVEQVGQSGGNGVTKKAAAFAYNNVNQLTSVTRYKDVSSAWVAVVQTSYGYDLMNRLRA